MTWAMMGAYQIIAHALLLNLLIAVFTNTYTRINTGTSFWRSSETHYARQIVQKGRAGMKIKALKRCRFGLEISALRFIENISCEITSDSTIQSYYVSIPNNILPRWEM